MIHANITSIGFKQISFTRYRFGVLEMSGIRAGMEGWRLGSFGLGVCQIHMIHEDMEQVIL